MAENFSYAHSDATAVYYSKIRAIQYKCTLYYSVVACVNVRLIEEYIGVRMVATQTRDDSSRCICVCVLSCWLRNTYFGEVADHVAAELVVFGEHVEQEWLDFEVQGLVVEEQLGEQTQVLTICLRMT